MGTRYSSQALSGFNASPPADDATVADSNRVQWQKHLDKIGTPLKNLAEGINTALVTALDQSATSTTTTAVVGATHNNQILEIASSVSTVVTITLSDAATMAAGYVVNIHNLSAVEHTLGRASGADTINGTASNVPIPAFSQIKAWVNSGANGYLVSHSEGILITGTVINAATQAQQETGTSTSVIVTPGRQHFHPSAAKAWISFPGAGSSISSSYNIASLTDTGTGQYGIVIATDFADTAYAAVISIDDSSSGANSGFGWNSAAKAAGQLDIVTSVAGGAATDPEMVYVAFYGDQN